MKTCVQMIIFLYLLHLKKRFTHGSIAYQSKRNFINQQIPREWSSLKDTEPGFEMSPEDIDKYKLWPDGIIPYYMDDLSYDSTLRKRLVIYLSDVSSITGLQFLDIKRPPDNDQYRYIFFLNRQAALGCVDYTTNDFTLTGPQRVVVGYDCTGGDLGALILAIAGVPPQHNSPDRDDYILVQFENILEDKKQLFNAMSPSDWLFRDVDYDFTSAGHYDFMQYSRNGAATIVARNPNKTRSFEQEEERGGFTYTDLWKIRMLYNRITRKRDKQNGSKSCSSLFKPGKGFAKYEPNLSDNQEEEEPRAKLPYKDDDIERLQYGKPQYNMHNEPRQHIDPKMIANPFGDQTDWDLTSENEDY